MQARLAKTKAAPAQEALTVPGRVIVNLFGNGLVLRCMVHKAKSVFGMPIWQEPLLWRQSLVSLWLAMP